MAGFERGLGVESRVWMDYMYELFGNRVWTNILSVLSLEWTWRMVINVRDMKKLSSEMRHGSVDR